MNYYEHMYQEPRRRSTHVSLAARLNKIEHGRVTLQLKDNVQERRRRSYYE